jgi:deoxyribodipyrimidine photolyase-related protein
MNCLRQVIDSTRRHAYAHHIQRLMITGNFALLAGLAPAEVEQWYLLVYADAFEWVELPNTHGMALFADGGLLASKPYAASGAYINRMSDYCSGCRFSPDKKLGEGACPFNYLYWHFLISNEKQLRPNPRMGLAYRNLSNKTRAEVDAIVQQSERFLASLDKEAQFTG